MIFFYRFLTIIFFPFFIFVIYLRKISGKEDHKRFKEKFILNKKKEFSDKLIWFHGASIGEILSIIPLVEYLQKKDNKLRVLITTVTLSSSVIIKKKIEKNNKIIHHFFPLDVPHLVRQFLDNWNPDFIAFVDSEIWPNFIFEIKKRKIPLALINARITEKTLHKWMMFKKFSIEIFSSFSICLASSLHSTKNLEKLNAKNIKYIGNLKFITNSKSEEYLQKNTIDYFNTRKVWCASNTHKGEEILCLQAHIKIKKNYENLITIIVPRHISRISNILSICKQNKLNVQIIKNENEINKNSEIILVNSFGELPKYYHYCKSVFIGKSLLKNLILVGGQNPIEAAVNGCKIYHGPYVYNFAEIYKYLNEVNVTKKVNNIEELANSIINDLKKEKEINTKDVKTINNHGKKILKETISQISNYI